MPVFRNEDRHNMPITNSLTSQAATRTAPNLNRSLTLLGIFTSADGTSVLIRTNDATNLMVQLGIPNDGLTLLETGDGWAMVEENNRIHRLVIA